MARSKSRTPTRTVSRRQFVARGAAVGPLAERALDDVSAVRAAGQATPGASSSQPNDPGQVIRRMISGYVRRTLSRSSRAGENPRIIPATRTVAEQLEDNF